MDTVTIYSSELHDTGLLLPSLFVLVFSKRVCVCLCVVEKRGGGEGNVVEVTNVSFSVLLRCFRFCKLVITGPQSARVSCYGYATLIMLKQKGNKARSCKQVVDSQG